MTWQKNFTHDYCLDRIDTSLIWLERNYKSKLHLFEKLKISKGKIYLKTVGKPKGNYKN